jgi:hypothetical protein
VKPGEADGTAEIETFDILEERSFGGPDVQAVAETPMEGPTFVTTERTYPTVRIVTRDTRRRNLVAVVVGFMGACILVLVAAALRPHASAAPVATVTVPDVSPTPPPRDSVDSVPWMPVTPPPSLPSSGTITAAAGVGALVVDGTRTTASVVVTCGRHQLRVGRGIAREVVVPCGGSLVVARGGKITVRTASEAVATPPTHAVASGA